MAGFVLGGCGTLASSVRGDAAAPPGIAGPDTVTPTALAGGEPASGADDAAAGVLVAQAGPLASDADLNDIEEEYDPWEPFNERMFRLNYNIDKYVLKPVARGYKTVVPEQLQIMIDNGFTNLKFPQRFINSLLQGKVDGAVREASRFVLNSTLGFGGLFDPGKTAGLEPSREDFGQTLGVWGAGPGPFLVLPLMEPMTVRDGIGRGVDSLLDPLSYVLPLFWDRVGMKIGETVNERALNYDLFQGVEETTIDLYSSVRHFYLRRREQQIRQ